MGDVDWLALYGFGALALGGILTCSSTLHKMHELLFKLIEGVRAIPQVHTNSLEYPLYELAKDIKAIRYRFECDTDDVTERRKRLVDIENRLVDIEDSCRLSSMYLHALVKGEAVVAISLPDAT